MEIRLSDGDRRQVPDPPAVSPFSLAEYPGDGSAFYEALHTLNSGRTIPRELAGVALGEVFRSPMEFRDSMLAALLVGSSPVVDPKMVAGYVDAISELEGRDLVNNKPKVLSDQEGQIVGCAGSGKKGRKTFNISTASMLVASAAGTKTLKTGSRSTSSITGSTDILEDSGFVIPGSTEESTEILQETGFGFYSIEELVPNFDSLYGQRFFAPHALSYVLSGILIPVKTDTLMYGYAGLQVRKSVESFLELGYENVFVASNTNDGILYIDELATTGTNVLAGAKNGKMGEVLKFDGAQFIGLEYQGQPDIDALPTRRDQNRMFQDVLSGNYPGSIAESTVCLNAATIIYLAKNCISPKEGFDLARQAIADGSAIAKLHEIVKKSKDLAR